MNLPSNLIYKETDSLTTALTKLRKREKLKQNELGKQLAKKAFELGIDRKFDQSTVTQHENGKRVFTEEDCRVYKATLNVPLTYAKVVRPQQSKPRGKQKTIEPKQTPQPQPTQLKKESTTIKSTALRALRQSGTYLLGKSVKVEGESEERVRIYHPSFDDGFNKDESGRYYADCIIDVVNWRGESYIILFATGYSEFIPLNELTAGTWK